MSTTAVQTALLWQSDYCRASGAPLSGEVLRLMAQDTEVAAAFAPVFAPYADLTPQAILTAAIPLRARRPSLLSC